LAEGKNPLFSHPWDLSPREALALQEKLTGLLIPEKRFNQVMTVAGIDVGFTDDTARAAIVVLQYPDLDILDQATASQPVTFPYIPGLLTFREGPVIIEAFRKLKLRPDLLIFDGQGQAHPRRLGIASHIGLLLDRPAIGCAKSRLCGQYEEPAPTRGSFSPLIHKGEIVGAVLRTRDRVKPVFVSPGHKIDLHASLEYVLTCCRGFRLPETTRLAHRLAGGQSL